MHERHGRGEKSIGASTRWSRVNEDLRQQYVLMKTLDVKQTSKLVREKRI